MKADKYILVIIVLLAFSVCFGQSQLDTLNQKTLQELFDLYEGTNNVSMKKTFLKEFVVVAKKEKKEKRIKAGYYLLSGLYDDHTSLAYSDSILNLTKGKNKEFLARAYFSKAYYYRKKRDFKNAIENFIISNKYAKEKNNKRLILICNYNIGTLKRKIGENREALKMYNENLPHLNKESNLYFRTLKSIANVYGELNILDSATYYNELGLKKSQKLRDEKEYYEFSSNEGIVQYLRGNYSVAIDSLEKSKIYFENNNKISSLSYMYYYLGKSHQKIGNEKKMIIYFSKVDSIFQFDEDLTPKFRESYESLITYYKDKDDLRKQLFYVNRLLNFDSVINADEIVLSKKIFKEYDIPKLKAEKKSLLKRKQKEAVIFQCIIVSIIFLLLTTIVFLIYQYKKKKLYKKRVREILEKRSIQEISNSKGEEKREINVPKEVVEVILKKLTEFETRKEFLSNKITLVSLAKDLDTNTNYLSKVINHYKNTTLSNYINSLRIEYTIALLKENKTVRKFTIKAIAEEVGYNNAESFSKTFYKFKGIKPSFFIQEVNKTKI